MIQAIGFDIDGTLYPANALFGRMLPGALARLPLLLAFNHVRKAVRKPGFYETLRLSVPANVEEFHRMQAELTARHLGWPLALTLQRIEDFFYRRQEAQFDHVRLFPGVRECLEGLREAGLPLAALSDFPAENKLARMKLADAFDIVMTSEDCGYVKPHHAPFDELARRFGVPHRHILYVGNSERYDIDGARAAGMQTALVSARPPRHSQPDFVFSDYSRLLAWVLERRG